MNRLLALRVASVAIGLLLPLLLIEAGLQLLPVTSGPWIDSVSAEQPIARFQANQVFTWSMFPAMEHVRHGRTNNAGFLSDTDYVPAQHRQPDAPPLVAVIGDSFVEALMVPLGSSFPMRLKEQLRGRGDVYSFGISGAPLSQYLTWAEHAGRVYKPKLLVVSVVSNDFDESLADYKLASDPGAARGFHYFKEDGDTLRLSLIENQPSLMRRAARSSAMVRYFYMNAGLRPDATLLMRLGLLRSPEDGLATKSTSDLERRLRHLFPVQEFEPLAEREALTRRAIDTFLAELPQRTALPPHRIVLTIDALRVSILDPTLVQLTSASLFGRMRAYLMERATSEGFTVVDLDPPMRRFVRETGRSVELSDDYHWNDQGHRIVAKEIAATPPFQSLFDVEISGARTVPANGAGTRLAR